MSKATRNEWKLFFKPKPKVTPQYHGPMTPAAPTAPDTSTYTKTGTYQEGEIEGFVYEMPDKWAVQAIDKDSRMSILSGIVHLPKDKWPTLEDAKKYLSDKLGPMDAAPSEDNFETMPDAEKPKGRVASSENYEDAGAWAKIK